MHNLHEVNRTMSFNKVGRSIQIVLLFTFVTCASPATIQTTDKTLQPEQIIKLIPDKIVGFSISKDPESKVIELGTLRYSIAEKNFSNRNRLIKVLLFDYKEAPIMYNQATRKWSTYIPVETDSLIYRPILKTEEFTGWESYDSRVKNSQILLGICDRFFLTVEGTGVELEFLKKVVQEFKFEAYPR